MEYYGHKEYASKGVAGAGLGLGIAGTALGLFAGGLNGGFGGRGLFGNGGYGHDGHGHHGECGCYETKEAAHLREEVAILKAEQCAERGDFALYRDMTCKFEDLQKEICQLKNKVDVDKLEAQYGDERIWCKMPETKKYIPCTEVINPALAGVCDSSTTPAATTPAA